LAASSNGQIFAAVSLLRSVADISRKLGTGEGPVNATDQFVRRLHA
jgi:hypothetical protein